MIRLLGTSIIINNNTLSMQIQDIVGKYGIVVISRFGHNPDQFIYESDNLTPLKVCVCVCVYF